MVGVSVNITTYKMPTILNLYTFKPTAIECDDSTEDREHDFYIQGLVESLTDPLKEKLACVLELKREHVTLLKKLTRDLIGKNTGHYFRNHILLDVLLLHNKYCQEFGEETAFGIDCIGLSLDMVHSVFEMFNNVTEVNVFVDRRSDPDDLFNVVLCYLQDNELINLQRVLLK